MKRTLIRDSEKDPLGAMLLAYLDGRGDAGVRVSSSRLEMSCMTGDIMCRIPDSRMELKALDLCRGHVLDAGAGSGCHALALQERQVEVSALDLSPGCVAVMKQRGVRQTLHDNLFNLDLTPFDTLLMLMNGIGICGSIDGLNLFLQFVRPLIERGGQVIADSTDLSVFCDDEQAEISKSQRYYGETDFVMTFDDIQGEPFDWLYVDFPTLDYYATLHGLSCDLIIMEQDGKFLVKIH